MQFLIAGSGTAGGLIGARLIERGANVTFCVSPQRALQLQRTGLVLQSPFGRFRRRVRTVLAGEMTTNYDVVIVAPRAHRYLDALQAVRPALGIETLVVPVLEGADHLEPAHVHGGHLIGGRLEARISIDADGVLVQRGPAAELKLGAAEDFHADRAEWLARLLAARGLTTSIEPQIGNAIWERFCFTAAAVAINALTGLSLRDATRPTHLITPFDRMMAEGVNVGRALGLTPRLAELTRYRKAFRMETQPVQPLALLGDGGARADEALYVLTEMVAIGERAGVAVPRLREARDVLIRPKLSVPSIDEAA